MQNLSESITVIRESDRSTWAYPVLDLESALIAGGMRGVVPYQKGLVRVATRGVARLGLIRNFGTRGADSYLAVLMGPAEYRLFPRSYLSDTILICFDCWPGYFDRWESIFRRNRTSLAFFTARQSAEYFSGRLPELKAVWMPEAVDPGIYQCQKPLKARSIDVLELGRRYDRYHNLIEAGLRHSPLRHLYEKSKGETIFSTRGDLVDGLSETRISICFPGSITSPERCGDIETVTHRYFESMASKCVIVGSCPGELSDLFGFNPVIDADFNDPMGQIEEILSRPDDYQTVVERNYRRLLEVGTWKVRAEFIKDEIRNHITGG